MTEIVLPIKCSTVKSLNERMEKLTEAAIYLTIASAFVWSITDIYRWGYLFYIRKIPEFAIIEISIATVIFVTVILFILSYAYDKAPKFTCIKDEETK